MSTFNFAVVKALEQAEIRSLPPRNNEVNNIMYVVGTSSKGTELRAFERRVEVTDLAKKAADAAFRYGQASARAVFGGRNSSLTRLELEVKTSREAWLKVALLPARVDSHMPPSGYLYLTIDTPTPLEINVLENEANVCVFQERVEADCWMVVTDPTRKQGDGINHLPGKVVATADAPKEGDDGTEPINLDDDNGDKAVAKFEKEVKASSKKTIKKVLVPA